MSTVKINVIIHLHVSYKLSCIDKFLHMRACLASSINIYMHALHVIAPKQCHIVAMSMPLLQLPNSLSLQVLLIKHWRQSTFAETPSMARQSREARQRRASMLVYISIYIIESVCLFVCFYRECLRVFVCFYRSPPKAGFYASIYIYI